MNSQASFVNDFLGGWVFDYGEMKGQRDLEIGTDKLLSKNIHVLSCL